MSDEIAKQIAWYVSRGLRVVQLHGVRGVDDCTCVKGKNCPNPGKHPYGTTWQVTDDEDKVFEWWGGSALRNVGVVLGGPLQAGKLAVIDIEADSEDAEEELQRLGIDAIDTPTWSSGRGWHRLFRWSPDLPDVAVKKVAGVEVRIGGNQAQSVLPPSRHHSGKQYAWRSGRGLEDCEIAVVPDSIMELLAADGGDTGTDSLRGVSLLRGRVKEGGRNTALLKFARMLVHGIDPREDQEDVLLAGLRAFNTAECEPPLPDREVVGIWRSVLKYHREELANERLFPGVQAVVAGARKTFEPVGLEATIFRGDPTIFELRCDAWKPINGSGIVRIPADVWSDSRKMKPALIGALPGVPFDRFPGDFARIWDGSRPEGGGDKKATKRAVHGLRVVLEQAAMAAGRVVEVTDPAENHSRRLVSLLVGRIDKCSDTVAYCRVRGEEPPEELEEIVELAERGGGFVGHGFWFEWEKMWRQIVMVHGLRHADSQKAMLVVADVIGRKLEPQRKTHDGQRRVLRCLSAQEVELLRSYAAGDARGAS